MMCFDDGSPEAEQACFDPTRPKGERYDADEMAEVTRVINSVKESMKNKEMNELLCDYYDAQNGGWLTRLIRRVTWRSWTRIVHGVINRAFERGLIDSFAFHELHATADRMIRPKKPNYPKAAGLATSEARDVRLGRSTTAQESNAQMSDR